MRVVKPFLYRRQAELLAFIRAYMREHGMAPSLAEMVSGGGATSVSNAHYLITDLVAGGHLRRRPGSARHIELLDGSVTFRRRISPGGAWGNISDVPAPVADRLLRDWTAMQPRRAEALP